jgi:hypothetical protein
MDAKRPKRSPGLTLDLAQQLSMAIGFSPRATIGTKQASAGSGAGQSEGARKASVDLGE